MVLPKALKIKTFKNYIDKVMLNTVQYDKQNEIEVRSHKAINKNLALILTPTNNRDIITKKTEELKVLNQHKSKLH